MKNIENVTVRKKIRKAFKPSKIATLDRLKNFMFSGYNEGERVKVINLQRLNRRIKGETERE